jgi:hypothetical protein
MTNLSPRLMLQVEASLERDCGCAETLRDLFERGRRLGLTSAEMDSALGGGGFEVRAAAAVALACALKAQAADDILAARAAAYRVGLTRAELAKIEELTRSHLAGAGR